METPAEPHNNRVLKRNSCPARRKISELLETKMHCVQQDSKALDLTSKVLGVTPSQEENDEMIDSCNLIDGKNGFTEMKKETAFYLDFSQFQTVIDQSFVSQIACDCGLSKFLSFGMFDYYMKVNFWMRLFQITSPRKTENTYEIISRALPDMPLTKEIDIYLASIGNISDPEKQSWKLARYLDLTDTQHGGAAGSFGKVTSHNHLAYETMPAPLVSLLAIEADMRYSRGEIDCDTWNLPTDLCPTAEGGYDPGLPTANLVGYRRAQNLTEEQLAIIDKNGIYAPVAKDPVFNTINIGNVPINQGLISFIAAQLKNSKCPLVQNTNKSTTGSLGQIPGTARSGTDHNYTRFKRIAAKLGIANSYSKFSPYIATASASFRYRLQRRAPHANDWCCYSWGDSRYIPQTCENNENDIWNSTPKWNINRFTLGVQNGTDLVTDLCQRTKMKL